MLCTNQDVLSQLTSIQAHIDASVPLSLCLAPIRSLLFKLSVVLRRVGPGVVLLFTLEPSSHSLLVLDVPCHAVLTVGTLNKTTLRSETLRRAFSRLALTHLLCSYPCYSPLHVRSCSQLRRCHGCRRATSFKTPSL